MIDNFEKHCDANFNQSTGSKTGDPTIVNLITEEVPLVTFSLLVLQLLVGRHGYIRLLLYPVQRLSM